MLLTCPKCNKSYEDPITPFCSACKREGISALLEPPIELQEEQAAAARLVGVNEPHGSDDETHAAH